MTKAFSYLRCSGDGQTTGDTWERQRETIIRYAAKNDLEIADEFRDEGVPGKTEMFARPGLSALLQRLEGETNAIVLIEIPDRLARDLIVFELIVREFQRLGVQVISASGGVDLTAGNDDNPTAKLIRQILAAICEFDRTVIVNKLRVARERLRTKNGKCEGRKSFGTFEGERIVLNTILQFAAQGLTPKQVAERLNEANVPTRYGKNWNPGSVWKIIARSTNGSVASSAKSTQD